MNLPRVELLRRLSLAYPCHPIPKLKLIADAMENGLPPVCYAHSIKRMPGHCAACDRVRKIIKTGKKETF